MEYLIGSIFNNGSKTLQTMPVHFMSLAYVFLSLCYTNVDLQWHLNLARIVNYF